MLINIPYILTFTNLSSLIFLPSLFSNSKCLFNHRVPRCSRVAYKKNWTIVIHSIRPPVWPHPDLSHLSSGEIDWSFSDLYTFLLTKGWSSFLLNKIGPSRPVFFFIQEEKKEAFSNFTISSTPASTSSLFISIKLQFPLTYFLILFFPFFFTSRNKREKFFHPTFHFFI